MSAAFNIILPLETVAAIQSGASEVVLGQLANLPDGQYRLIHDVARNVFTAVNAVPYNIVPKTAPAGLDTVASTFSELGLSAPVAAFSPVGSDAGKESTVFTPMSPQYTPSSPSYSTVSRADDGWGPPYGSREVRFTIRDLMNHDEDFFTHDKDDFHGILGVYSARTGIPASTLGFFFENDWKIDPASYGTTMSELGISNGTLILAKPKVNEPIHTTTSTYIIRDLMLSEEEITLNFDDTFGELVSRYAERTGHEADKLSFTHLSGITIPESAYQNCLPDILWPEETVVLVHPKREANTTIIVVFRDAMGREESIGFMGGTTLKDLEETYLWVTTSAHGKFEFGFRDTIFGGGVFAGMDKKLSEIGIGEGSVVKVGPVDSLAEAIHSESLAGDCSDVPKENQKPLTFTVTVRDLMMSEELIDMDERCNIFELVGSWEQSTGRDGYGLSWTFDGEVLDFSGSISATTALVHLGITAGSVVTIAPKKDMTITCRDLMLNETCFALSSDAYTYDLFDRYEDDNGVNTSDLTFTFEGQELNAGRGDGNCCALKELGITDGSVVTVGPKIREPEITVTVRDAMLNEQEISVPKTSTIFNLLDAYGAPNGIYAYDLAWSFNGYELDTDGRFEGPFDLEDLGITTGSVVLIAPKAEVTVIFRDQMLKEHRATVKESDALYTLTDLYLDSAMVDASSVFFVLGTGEEIDCSSGSFDHTVKTLGITDGSVINVHPAPKVPEPEITVIFRDQMFRETEISIPGCQTFPELSQQHRAASGLPNSYFYSLSNGMELHGGSAEFNHALKSLGITDGSLINVHPYPTPSVPKYEPSLASGFSGVGGW